MKFYGETTHKNNNTERSRIYKKVLSINNGQVAPEPMLESTKGDSKGSYNEPII